MTAMHFGSFMVSFLMLLVYRVRRLVAVADVPVSRLDLLNASCPDCLPVLMLCLHLALDLLHDGQHLRGRITRGEKETGSCHCFVFHALSIGDLGCCGENGGHLAFRHTDHRRAPWVYNRTTSLRVILYAYQGNNSSLQNVGMINCLPRPSVT